jgi:hypothetical protein
MKQKPWKLEELSQLFFFGSTLLLGLLAMINPRFVYSVLGAVIGILGLILITYYGYKLYRYFSQFQRMSNALVSPLIILFLLALLFIFIPASSLAALVAWLTLLSLVGYGFYRLYFIAKYFHRRLTILDWMLGLGAWGLAILVLFNLNKTPDIIMFFIGGVLIYFSGYSLFRVLLKHQED